MTESQLQHSLIMWFSQEYPQYRGLLFYVDNSSYSVSHGSKKKSIGSHSGVSDLIFITPETGQIVGIELKSPGSQHKRSQLDKEIEWGCTVITNGGRYIISSDIFLIKKLIFCPDTKKEIELIEYVKMNTKF